ncbi:DsbA family protein [Phenylobacterium sp.]|uniref:DsbA family protein n=1 Tax=Phenylobacterium sp. TaxID=1871053 RepID=UPI0025F11D29|nr:DsbA family protein [Phenylobacterium sp.]
MPTPSCRVPMVAAALLALGAASLAGPVSAAPTAVAAARAAWPSAPGDMNLGNPRAPVHIVEYLSLTCPHCAHFNEEVYPAFKAKYIDTGRVYYTIRELLTSPAQVAAAGFLLARCGDGSKYFTIVDQVFKSQPRWQSGQIKPVFVEIAKANGITEAQFEACVADDKTNAALEGRLRYATETDHVTGTPTFFINGVRMDNAQVPALTELDAAIVSAAQTRPAAKPPAAKPAAVKPKGGH